MNVIKELFSAADQANTPYLIIDGHALSAHGYERSTKEIELITTNTSRDFWIEKLTSLNYELALINDKSARFEPLSKESQPIILRFTKDEIIREIMKDAIDTDISGYTVKVPSVRHLIALKMHALKQSDPEQEYQHTMDVHKLLEIGQISDEDFKVLCLKYDRIDIYERLQKLH